MNTFHSGLSVVRPEILFGTSESSNEEPGTPQSLLSSLHTLLSRKPEDAVALSMRDAFRRVLKLYGMQVMVVGRSQIIPSFLFIASFFIGERGVKKATLFDLPKLNFLKSKYVKICYCFICSLRIKNYFLAQCFL